MWPFGKRRKSPLAPEAENAVEAAKQTAAMLTAVSARFTQIYGQGAEPGPVRAHAERVDRALLDTGAATREQEPEGEK